MRKVGFYLDDWATMAYLHFAPAGDPLALMRYYFLNDPRVQGRPLEVLHFGLIYWFAGAQPLAFHLVNLGLELLAAALAYLVFLRLSALRAPAFLAALFFMLNPSHDSTHYWVICSSVTLSMCLYLLSLLGSLQSILMPAAAGIKRILPLCGGAVCYFLSLLN